MNGLESDDDKLDTDKETSQLRQRTHLINVPTATLNKLQFDHKEEKSKSLSCFNISIYSIVSIFWYLSIWVMLLFITVSMVLIADHVDNLSPHAQDMLHHSNAFLMTTNKKLVSYEPAFDSTMNTLFNITQLPILKFMNHTMGSFSKWFNKINWAFTMLETSQHIDLNAVKADITKFVDKVRAMPLENTLQSFIHLSEAFMTLYEKWMQSGAFNINIGLLGN